jgi:tetratricopeptide (TPR) repeat protein
MIDQIMNTLLRTSFDALVMAVAMGAAPAGAAEVRSGISTRETYVGMPVTFQVQVANAKNFDPPMLPEIPGLRIESAGTPSRSTQTTIINGSVSTRSSVTYSFTLTPTRTGAFQIPAIEVQADGETLSTRPFDFVASKSETGDLLFVEIIGREKEIYVGQALDLTLKIWVRPYRDAEYNVTLSEGDMWQLLSQKSQWGRFAERITELTEKNQRPVGSEVFRTDRDGVDHGYYLYELDATIYPKKPGRIDADDVQVIALYPTAIGESRSPFGGMMNDMGFPDRGSMFSPFAPRLTIESVRPIVAEAKVEPIEVREIPVADRPADYRGAVGKYRMVTGATPTEVKAGDPITLQLGIAGTGPMELVQAPPLAELPTLTKDFKVPTEPLAGYVEGARKVFSTTIRPRQAGITQIPAIPFTYFDPEVGKFVTVESDPISIAVAPAEMLALDDVVGRSQSGGHSDPGMSGGTAEAGLVLANFTGDDLLTSQSSPTATGQGLWIALALPPVVVFGLLIVRGRVGVAWVAGRFRSVGRRFAAEIEAASGPTEVAAALQLLLRKRFGLPASADDTELVGALRTAGYRHLAVRCERILEQCDAFSAVQLHDLKRHAIELADELEAQSRPTTRRPMRPARRLRPTTAVILAAAALLSGTAGARAVDVSGPMLTAAQQQTILAEAGARYDAARQVASSDSAEAKEAFADAAEKYQLLADSGVRNARLYFNLGNAYLESGATGRAIANYRRALALEPTNRAAQTNLDFATSALAAKEKDTPPVEMALADQFVVANSWLNRFVRPRWVASVALAAWFAFWIALGLRIFEVRFAWKSVAVAALAIAAVTATSYTLTCRSLAQSSAVVVAPTAALRTGDGERFAAVGGAQVPEGQSVDLLRQRGAWVQVRTPAGRTGWLPGDAVEVL